MALSKKVIIYDGEKNTPLHFAAARNCVEDAIKELDESDEIDPENYMGWTPLMMAARKGHQDMVQLLLNNRADATKQNKYGVSVFIMAVASGNMEPVSTILNHLMCGGVSKQSMESVLSPISISILCSQFEIFQFLLMKGFSENALNNATGITPLMFAALNENDQFYSILVSRGGNPKIKTSNKETAEEVFAKRRGLANNTPQESPKECYLHHQGVSNMVLTYLTPSFSYLVNSCVQPQVRKSSDALTPNNIYTPNIAPITPVGYYHQQQMFFPPAFSPSQFLSPYYGDMMNWQGYVQSPHLNSNIESSLYVEPF